LPLPDGKMIGVIRQSDASTSIVQAPALNAPSAGKRKSWREINVQ
jgi:hypothetical protein